MCPCRLALVTGFFFSHNFGSLALCAVSPPSFLHFFLESLLQGLYTQHGGPQGSGLLGEQMTAEALKQKLPPGLALNKEEAGIISIKLCKILPDSRR